MDSRARIALAGVVVAVAAGVVLGLTLGSHSDHAAGGTNGSGISGAAFDGAALPSGVAAAPFTLTDVLDGRRVSLAEYRGRVVVLAFLYSSCAACVLVAQQVRGGLDEVRRPVDVLFVSVDPARDTRARVRDFLAQVSLSGRVRYLSGPRGALEAVWRGYRVTTPSAGRAAFERGVEVVLIDADGDERVLYQPEQLTPEALAHDVGRLRDG